MWHNVTIIPESDMTASQKAWTAQSIMNMLGIDAKRRQEASRAKSGEKIGEHKVVGNFPPPIGQGKARDQAAKIIGVSGRMN